MTWKCGHRYKCNWRKTAHRSTLFWPSWTILFVLVWLYPFESQSEYDVYEVEAVMLSRLVSFIQWPKSAGLTDPKASLEFVCLGETPLVDRLTQVLSKGKLIKRPFRVKQIWRIEKIHSPHILFLPASTDTQLESILLRVGRSPILTVSDTPGFAQRGVALNFYREGGKLRIEINRKALKLAGLSVNYRLFSIARVVHGGDNP